MADAIKETESLVRIHVVRLIEVQHPVRISSVIIIATLVCLLETLTQMQIHHLIMFGIIWLPMYVYI